jgi:spore coat protein U-like protein
MHRFRVALIRIAAAAATLLIAGADPAEAAKCSVSATAVVFGTYNVFNTAPVDSTGTIVYECNGGARNVMIAITKGLSSTFAPRELASGTERLAYNLFRDAARTNIWGDFSGGSSAYIDANPPNKQDITLTVYGRIPSGQDVRAGSYADTVTVVVNY